MNVVWFCVAVEFRLVGGIIKVIAIFMTTVIV